MAYWQMACGDGNVDLEEIFLKLNVALVGPGDIGDYFDHKAQYALEDKRVRRFCDEVEIGDIFVLKRVLNPHTREWQIIAVGEVIGPYRYEPIFKDTDVDSWQMQHCRRVHWKVVPTQQVVVQGGGAPITIQKLRDDNPLRLRADELLQNQLP